MDGDDRTSSNSAIGALLGYVGDTWGDDTVTEVLREAGETRPMAELRDPTFWSTADQSEELFRAARLVTGDDDLPRKVGASLLTRYASSEVIAVFGSLQDIGVGLQLVTEAASKMSTAITSTLLEIGDRHALVSCRLTTDSVPSPKTCEYVEGIFMSLPTHQGMPPADVTQLECIARGDDQCLFEIHWDPEAANDPEVQVRYLRQRVDAMARRFEALEEMAIDLAQVTEVDELLDRIIHRAGIAVRAPRYLLAVTLPGDRRPRVHHVGFDDDELDRVAADILRDAPDDDNGAHLIVDVVAAGTSFGRLGAFYPSGHRFLPAERSLLTAYAGHAGAALQTAALMADRHRQAETNAALLSLSTALAEVATAQQLAGRLGAAIPGVVACDRCAVLVWEAGDDHFVLSTPGGSGRDELRVQLPPAVRRRLTILGEPSVAGDDVPELERVFDALDIGTGVTLVPVAANGELLAMIVLGRDPDPATMDRGVDPVGADADPITLAVVAGLAATAFENALLIQRIEHQARHDPLTGLANLRQFRELTATALFNARRRGETAGLLFVDLDGFKAVNDRFGHATGDDVLSQVADRLRGAVRAGDTVGRIGGDEFVVLLPQVQDDTEITALADRILDAVRRPITGAAAPVTISASIGAALATERDGVDVLLAEADSAMYRAKAAGGARCERMADAGH